jgi:signal transduction histidine kinase
MKLRTKLILFVLGVVILPVLFSGIIGYYLHLRREWVPSPANIRRVLGELERAGLAAEEEGAREKADFSAVKLPVGLTVWVLDSSDRIVYTNAAGGEGKERFDPIGVGPGHFLIKTLGTGEAGGFKVAFHFPEEPPEPRKPRPFFVRFLERSMWWLFALIVFSSAMISVIVRSFNRDIAKLTKATGRVADGDLDFELTAKGNDEIAYLTRSFDSMRKNLKESIARRSRFLMGVSHDLKTPLTSIKGYLEAISDGLADDPVKLGRYLSVIGEKSKALEERIGKLIDYVRMETGDWRMSQEEINLKPFLAEISEMYEEDASVFKRSFRSDLRLPERARTTADRALLLRCFENLFDNAIRYTKEGDTIALSALLKGDEVIVVFRDTGAGIEERELNRVFEPFYRGTRSRREEGSGLGLSIVKSIVDAHGWSIGIESTPGQGTALTLRISPVKTA